MPRTGSGGSSGGSVAVINNLTSGGTAVALSAEMGKSLKALVDAITQGAVLFSSGVPSNANGVDGQVNIRTDAPFFGAVYLKTAGAWVLADNTYSGIANLPADGVGNLGAVVRLTDATYAPQGIDLQCVTYDSGTSYWWRPVQGSWRMYNAIDKDTATAGSGSNVTSFTFTTPNRTDLFMPGCDLHVRLEAQGTGNVGTRTFRASALTMNGGSSSTLCEVTIAAGSNGLSFRTENFIHLSAANTGFSHPFTAITSSTSSVANTTYSGTNWHNLAITFVKNGSSASDTVQMSARSVTLIWP